MGSGVPATDEAASGACRLVSQYVEHGIFEFDAVLRTNGDIRVVGYKAELSIDGIAHGSGLFSVTLEKCDEEVFELANESLEAISSKLNLFFIAQTLCHSFWPSTSTTTSPGSNDLVQKLLNHQAKSLAGAYQQFAKIVQKSQVELSAITSPSSTVDKWEIPLSSGQSTPSWRVAMVS